MELGAQGIRLRRHDGEAAHPFAGMGAPILPQASQRHQALVRQRDGIGLLACRRFLPLVEVIDRHELAAPLECFAKGRPVLDPFGLGVDICRADVDVLGPVRDQTPSQKIQAALAGPPIVPEHREHVSRRGVPTGRKFGVGRWGGIEKTSLISHIGRKANPATHTASIAGPGRRPKR
jgi:hypothetical protein